jgi:hypothetical protein
MKHALESGIPSSNSKLKYGGDGHSNITALSLSKRGTPFGFLALNIFSTFYADS